MPAQDRQLSEKVTAMTKRVIVAVLLRALASLGRPIRKATSIGSFFEGKTAVFRPCLGLLIAMLLLTAVGLNPTASAADKEAKGDAGKVAGILIDKGPDWLTVKADGEDEPVKYLVNASDKRLQEAFKAVFNASRVHLAYKEEGESRQLVSIKRHIPKAAGTMTGEVVKVYNEFWVEVKPKSGLADAFAPGADNYNDKAFMERLKGLKSGDSVTIAFTTDFERHRIKTLRKNPPRSSKSGGSASSTKPSKKQ